MPFVLYRWENNDDPRPSERKAWNEKDDVLRDCKQAIKEMDDNLINRFLVVWEEPVV